MTLSRPSGTPARPCASASQALLPWRGFERTSGPTSGVAYHAMSGAQSRRRGGQIEFATPGPGAPAEPHLEGESRRMPDHGKLCSSMCRAGGRALRPAGHSQGTAPTPAYRQSCKGSTREQDAKVDRPRRGGQGSRPVRPIGDERPFARRNEGHHRWSASDPSHVLALNRTPPSHDSPKIIRRPGGTGPLVSPRHAGVTAREWFGSALPIAISPVVAIPLLAMARTSRSRNQAPWGPL